MMVTRVINGRKYKLVRGNACNGCCFSNPLDFTKCLYVFDKFFNLQECWNQDKVWKKTLWG